MVELDDVSRLQGDMGQQADPAAVKVDQGTGVHHTGEPSAAEITIDDGEFNLIRLRCVQG